MTTSDDHEHAWRAGQQHIHIKRNASPMTAEEFHALLRFGVVAASVDLSCACGQVKPAECPR